jgi:hemerythrin HHE cation binding domain-containing protein
VAPLATGIERLGKGYTVKMDKDAITVLSEDHSALHDLFARVSRTDEDRPAVLDELVRSLSGHVSAEKQLVMPVLRRQHDDGEVLAEQLGQDHDAIEKLVILVERRKVNSPGRSRPRQRSIGHHRAAHPSRRRAPASLSP